MAVATKKIELSPLEKNIKRVEEEKKNLRNTPPIGTNVVWHRKADPANENAAVVTRVEGVGRVGLTIFPPNGMSEHVTGCTHSSDPVHKNRNNASSQRSGSWDYPVGYKPPADHKDLHKAEIEAKLKGYNRQLEQAKEIKEKQEGSSVESEPPKE